MGRLDVRRVLQDPLSRAPQGRKERREELDVARHHQYRKPPDSCKIVPVRLRWTEGTPGVWYAKLPGGWARVTKVDGLWVRRGGVPKGVSRWRAEISIPAVGWDHIDLGASAPVVNDPRRTSAVFLNRKKAQEAVVWKLERALRLHPAWAPWIVGPQA